MQNIAAGNWKMNTTLEEGKILASEVIEMTKDEVISDTEVILFPPLTHLTTLVALAKGSPVKIGAQNLSDKEKGAFTGEVSAAMIKSIGVTYVLVGHSERRELFNENDAVVTAKMQAALEAGLQVIYCCGEPLEVREAGTHLAYVGEQITASILKLSEEELKRVAIAYEPIWAIGTGKTASSAEAQEMHAHIRGILASSFGNADEISILYGGSVKPDNAKEIFSEPDVNGGLIGGASLKSRDFVDIAKSF